MDAYAPDRSGSAGKAHQLGVSSGQPRYHDNRRVHAVLAYLDHPTVAR